MTRYVDNSRQAQRAIAFQLLQPVGRTARTLARRIGDRVRTEGLVDSGEYAGSWRASAPAVSRNSRRVVAIAESSKRVAFQGRDDAIPLALLTEYGATRSGRGGVQAPTPHIRPETEAIGSELLRAVSNVL